MMMGPCVGEVRAAARQPQLAAERRRVELDGRGALDDDTCVAPSLKGEVDVMGSQIGETALQTLSASAMDSDAGDDASHSIPAVEGWITKQGVLRKSWKRRWARLSAGSLSWSVEPSLAPRGVVVLSSDTVIDPLPRELEGAAAELGLGLAVRQAGRTLLFCTRSAGEHRAWLASLERACAAAETARGARRTSTPRQASAADQQPPGGAGQADSAALSQQQDTGKTSFWASWSRWLAGGVAKVTEPATASAAAPPKDASPLPSAHESEVESHLTLSRVRPPSGKRPPTPRRRQAGGAPGGAKEAGENSS